MRRAVLLNSFVWAAVVLAAAFILKGADSFIPMLIILLMGSVASDAVIGRYGDLDSKPSMPKRAAGA